MPIICHLKSADEPKPFNWVGEGIVRHRRRPTELHYRLFIHGDLKVEHGDFVLVRNDEAMDPEDSMNCFVGRVDDLYESDDDEVPHKAKVQWFSRIFELPPQFIRNLPDVDYHRELIEDNRSEFSQVIDAESIFSTKCIVITVQEDLNIKPPENPHMSVFYCRYKFTGSAILTKMPKDMDCESIYTKNAKDVSSPNHIGHRKTPRHIKSELVTKVRKKEPSDIQCSKDPDFENSASLNEGLKSLTISIPRIDHLLNSNDNTVDYRKINLNGKEMGKLNGMSDFTVKSPRTKVLRSLKNEVSLKEIAIKSRVERKSNRLKKSSLKVESPVKSEVSDLPTPAINETITYQCQDSDSTTKVKSTRRSSRKILCFNEKIEKCSTTPRRKTKLDNLITDNKSPISERKSAKRSLDFSKKHGIEGSPIMTTTRYGRKVKSVNNLFGSDIDSLLASPTKTPKKKNRSLPRKNAKFYHSDSSDDESAYDPSAHGSSDEVFSDAEDFIAIKRKSPSAQKNIFSTPQSKKKGQTPITPTIPSRYQPVSTPQNLLEESRQRLHVSAVPTSLPCREEEFSDIFSFIRSNLLNKSGGCMYVSGVPGTGKTATVHEVINSLEKEKERNRVPSFQFVEVNGMKMTDPYQCYVQIFQKLTGERIAPQQAANLLEKRFTQVGPKKEATVLLVDELDKLWTRKQTVMYNIFDWPSKTYSKLIVIAIANTMDLPERMMMNRVASRLGLTRKTFQPYTFRELQEIVMSRIRELQVFNPDAVQLVARKVAAISGDARRALEICRRAAEIAEEGSVKASPSKKQRMLVEMAHVDAALNQMFSSPVVAFIRGCSEFQKAFFRAILAEFQRTGSEETNLLKAYYQLVPLCRFEGLRSPTTSDLSTVCVHLASSNIVLIDNVQNDLCMKIRLNVSIDDVNYALTGHMP